MKQKIVIYWCRRDFRLLDNPALFEAVKFAKEKNLHFLPIYILDTDILKTPGVNIGLNRKRILSFILADFVKQFMEFRIFCGKPVDIFHSLLQDFTISLFFNDDIEPYALTRDAEINHLLEKNDSKTRVFKDQLTINPHVLSQSGTKYIVYTPFKNVVLEDFLKTQRYDKVNLKEISPVSSEIIAKLKQIGLEQLDSKITKEELNKSINDKILAENDKNLFFGKHKLDLSDVVGKTDLQFYFQTEKITLNNFQNFLDKSLLSYKTGRDDLANDVELQRPTSHMSMGLKWGLVSARTLKTLILNKFTIDQVLTNPNIAAYISELIWREFYKYILYHNPHVLNLEFQVKLQKKVVWEEDDIALKRFKAWVYGKTGYKIVDAAMNQIIQEGWMHNRSRMIVASVLSKNLGVDWRWGQEYFRLMLVDLDESSNNGGWQWAASVGADPKPIRIFNPYLQAEKFDSDGRYQQKWLPQNYQMTEPIIKHVEAREQALKRYGLLSRPRF